MATLKVILEVISDDIQSLEAAAELIESLLEKANGEQPKTKEVAKKKTEAKQEITEPETTPKEQKINQEKLSNIRVLVAQKIEEDKEANKDTNRTAIKAELKKVGAENVTKIGAEHYDAFTDFLNAL